MSYPGAIIYNILVLERATKGQPRGTNRITPTIPASQRQTVSPATSEITAPSVATPAPAPAPSTSGTAPAETESGAQAAKATRGDGVTNNSQTTDDSETERRSELVLWC